MTNARSTIEIIVGVACLFFAFGISQADTSKIRVSVDAEAEDSDSGKMVSLLSREFRLLDGVVVTDTQPQFKISCVLIGLRHGGGPPAGYAASIAVTDADDRLITHVVQTDASLEKLAHEVAVGIDGRILEPIRRATSAPTSSP